MTTFTIGFFNNVIYIDKFIDNEFVESVLQSVLPEEQTAREKVVSTFRYIAVNKELAARK